jgi:hypothetical protein
MPTITFDVLEGALSALRLSPTALVKDIRVAVALLHCSHGEPSQSKAAKIAPRVGRSSSTSSRIGESLPC